MTGYFIWSGGAELFSFGSFALRWSAVLFVLAFLLGRQLLLYLCKKEDNSFKAISTLSIFLVFAAVIGARLGYLLFYEPQSIFSKGLTIILPFELKPAFHLLDRNEFSVHGAVLGMLLFLWFYNRKNVLKHTYFQLLDSIAMVAIFSGIFLLMGSFFNSEIEGKPTGSSLGAVLVTPVQKGLLKIPCCIMRSPDGKNPLEKVVVKKNPSPPKREKSQKSIIVYLYFQPGASERLVNEFLIGDVKTFLYEMSPYVHEPGDQPLRYTLFLEKNGNYTARIYTLAIARYPLQLFEACTCLVVFILLWFLRNKLKHTGRLFAISMILFWSFHLAYGFLGETQPPVGIVLSSCFVLAGFCVLGLSFRKSFLTSDETFQEKYIVRKD